MIRWNILVIVKVEKYTKNVNVMVFVTREVSVIRLKQLEFYQQHMDQIVVQLKEMILIVFH